MAESSSSPSNKTTPTSCTPVQVQHVTKTSSDKLLLKFADPDSPKSPVKKHLPLALRRKKSSRRVASGLSARELIGGSDEWKVKRRRSGGAAEWRAGLLLPVSTREKKANGSLIRKNGIGRIDDVAGIGLILAALERTWQKTVASASKVFVEKHRTGHVRLISDMDPLAEMRKTKTHGLHGNRPISVSSRRDQVQHRVLGSSCNRAIGQNDVSSEVGTER